MYQRTPVWAIRLQSGATRGCDFNALARDHRLAILAVIRFYVRGCFRTKKRTPLFRASAGTSVALAYLGVDAGGSFTLCVD
jgi:hypothetical protein